MTPDKDVVERAMAKSMADSVGLALKAAGSVIPAETTIRGVLKGVVRAAIDKLGEERALQVLSGALEDMAKERG